MVDIVTTIFGISFALIATICFNLAIIYQKKALMAGLPDIEFDTGVGGVLTSFKAFFQNKTWLFGFSLGIIGWFPYIIAMGLVGILVVQPVMGVGLILFVFAANKILGEKVTIFEIIAIAMLGVAPILITFAGVSDVNIDLYSFVAPLSIFLAILISISVVCFYISKSKRGTNLEGLFIMFTGSILYALGAVFTNILAQAFKDSQVFPLFFWEMIFGIFWFEYFHLWLFLGFWGMAIFNVVSVAFYQSAFQKGKALIMFPILNSFSLIIPIIAGLFVFNQSFAVIYLFLIAIVLILIATLTLSRFQAEIETLEKEVKI